MTAHRRFIIPIAAFPIVTIVLIFLGFESGSAGASKAGAPPILKIDRIIPGSWGASPIFASHNPGSNCLVCHPSFTAAGTVFRTSAAAETAPGAPVVFTGPDGTETVLAVNSLGNLATKILKSGRYLIRVSSITSRTWHDLPAQSGCNTCHRPEGNASRIRTRTLHAYHTRIPSDNDCRHCHHFPASQTLEKLKTTGVLQTAAVDPPLPGSRVEILGRVFEFDPAAYAIQTTRPDIFAPGYFSMFDVIIAVARRNNIRMSYRFDMHCLTYFIRTIEGRGGDYWYRFSYDAGDGNAQELGNRRAVRWDEVLWRPGVWIKVTEGENLNELKAAYLKEIARERTQGHVVPNVRISVNPSNFQGNPATSDRTTVSRDFYNVTVTPHDWRAAGTADPNPKPFRPGVVTSLDILLSLQDQGALDLVTGTFYTFFGGHYIHSYYVVALGFPGVGTAHASGRQGFIYTTENGTPNQLPNKADAKMHMTSDIHVLHAPDFSSWRWAELGNPYYENILPGGAELMRDSIAEDFEAVGRGFNLHAPVVLSDDGGPAAKPESETAIVPSATRQRTILPLATPPWPETANDSGRNPPGLSCPRSRSEEGGQAQGFPVLIEASESGRSLGRCKIGLSLNIFEPGIYRLEVRNDRGMIVGRFIDGRIENIGIVKKSWSANGLPGGRYSFVATNGKHTQVRDLIL